MAHNGTKGNETERKGALNGLFWTYKKLQVRIWMMGRSWYIK